MPLFDLLWGRNVSPCSFPGFSHSKVPPGFSYSLTTVNGQMGIVTYTEGQPYNVTSFQVENGQIAAVYLVVNPDKLRHIL